MTPFMIYGVWTAVSCPLSSTQLIGGTYVTFFLQRRRLARGTSSGLLLEGLLRHNAAWLAVLQTPARCCTCLTKMSSSDCAGSRGCCSTSRPSLCSRCCTIRTATSRRWRRRIPRAQRRRPRRRPAATRRHHPPPRSRSRHRWQRAPLRSTAAVAALATLVASRCARSRRVGG